MNQEAFEPRVDKQSTLDLKETSMEEKTNQEFVEEEHFEKLQKFRNLDGITKTSSITIPSTAPSGGRSQSNERPHFVLIGDQFASHPNIMDEGLLSHSNSRYFNSSSQLGKRQLRFDQSPTNDLEKSAVSVNSPAISKSTSNLRHRSSSREIRGDTTSELRRSLQEKQSSEILKSSGAPKTKKTVPIVLVKKKLEAAEKDDDSEFESEEYQSQFMETKDGTEHAGLSELTSKGSPLRRSEQRVFDKLTNARDTKFNKPKSKDSTTRSQDFLLPQQASTAKKLIHSQALKETDSHDYEIPGTKSNHSPPLIPSQNASSQQNRNHKSKGVADMRMELEEHEEEVQVLSNQEEAKQQEEDRAGEEVKSDEGEERANEEPVLEEEEEESFSEVSVYFEENFREDGQNAPSGLDFSHAFTPNFEEIDGKFYPKEYSAQVPVEKNSIGKAAPLWYKFYENQDRSSYTKNLQDIQAMTEWMRSEPNCKTNDRFINFASNLLRVLLESKNGFDTIRLHLKKRRSPDLLAYFTFLADAENTSFQISEVQNPEFAAYCLEKSPNGYALTRMATLKYELAEWLYSVFRKLVRSASFYNKMKFTCLGKQNSLNSPSSSQSTPTWHKFNKSTLADRAPNSQSEQPVDLSNLGTKVISPRAAPPNRYEANSFLLKHEPKKKKTKSDSIHFRIAACPKKNLPALLLPEYPLDIKHSICIDLLTEFCGSLALRENTIVQTGLKGGVEISEGTFKEWNPYNQQLVTKPALDFLGLQEHWHQEFATRQLDPPSFMALKSKVQFYLEKNLVNMVRPIKNECVKAISHFYLTDKQTLQPTELFLDSGVKSLTSTSGNNSLVSEVDWTTKLNWDTTSSWDFLLDFLHNDAHLFPAPLLSIQNLVSEDLWALYYSWDCFVADDYALSLFATAQYLRCLGRNGLNQEVRNLKNRSSNGDQVAQNLLDNYIPTIKNKVQD